MLSFYFFTELAKSAAAAEELERKRMEAEEEAQRLEEKRKEVEEEKVRMELLLQSETQEKEELVSVFITIYLHMRLLASTSLNCASVGRLTSP